MSPQAILADRNFARVKRLLLEATGMAYYAERDEELAYRLSRRFANRNVQTCGAYLVLLDKGGNQEFDAIIADLTIGETYFFRQQAQFRALAQTLFPELIRRNEGIRTLRIWSAGCSTGAEPYSVALLLADEFGNSLDGWHVSILGTDINRTFLARAREGRYPEWAFRECPADLKSRAFNHEGGEWVIRPEYRKWVSFVHHNLVCDPVPSSAHGIYSFDLILCRNVMIYFAPAIVLETVERLNASLVPGGWLLVGHAEPSAEVFRGFRTWVSAECTLYQKLIGGELPPPATPQCSAEVSGNSAIPPCWPGVPMAPAPPPVVTYARKPSPLTPPPKPPETAPAGLEQVRALADRGCTDEALAACRALLERDGLNPQGHFLLALLLEHAGRLDESEAALRRAVYLDREFVLAHYYLGLALQRKQDHAHARRSLANVARLLRGRTDGDTIEGSDGMTVGDLKQMITMHMGALER